MKLVGVCWNKKNRKWRAEIGQDGKRHRLGYFDDEREAARAFDTVVRRLRGEDAHGGRAGRNWLRLNFPSGRRREPKRSVCQQWRLSPEALERAWTTLLR